MGNMGEARSVEQYFFNGRAPWIFSGSARKRKDKNYLGSVKTVGSDLYILSAGKKGAGEPVPGDPKNMLRITYGG